MGVYALAKKTPRNTTPSTLAAIYARYSSHSQNDASIEQQVAECKEYARTNKLEVVNIYADRALTGRTDKRPEFQRMMRAAEKGGFQVVIAYKSNRIARNMLNALSYEEKLSNFGVRLAYVKEEFGNNAAGRFALRTMMNMNQFYSENMAEDILRGLRDNASQCKSNGGALPLGYKIGDDGKYAIDEHGANIVREIFQRVANGETFVSIGKDLNARGIRTSKNNEWHKNSFHWLLANERYIGVYQYQDIRIEDGVPPIIDKELFYTVKQKVEDKKAVHGRHNPNGDYLLTGKLYCGHCKGHMVGLAGTSRKGVVHHYYGCQTMRIAKTCNKASVRRDWAERLVASAINEYILHDDVIEWIADSVVAHWKKYLEESQVAYLEGRLADNKKAKSNILKAIEEGIITPTTKDRLLELEGEHEKLVGQIALEKAGLKDVTREQVVFWLKSLKEGDIEDKKYQAALIDTFVIAAYVAEAVEANADKASECSYKVPVGARICALAPIRRRVVLP